MVETSRWLRNVMSSIVDCELAHQSVPPHRGWGFGKMTGTLRYGMLAPGCITQSPQDGCSRGGELKSPNRMVSLPSVSNVMAYGGMPQKYTQLPVSFVSAHNRGRRRTGNQNLRSSHHRAVAVSSQPLVRGGRRARGSVIVNRLVMVGPFSRRHP